MNEKFFDLKKEKQDRMINAALKAFALSGYRHASTDDIVREAAISNGLLFHYFESKLGVYAFVYDYSVRYLLLELSTGGGCEGNGPVCSDAAGGMRENACYVPVSLSAAVFKPGTV